MTEYWHHILKSIKKAGKRNVVFCYRVFLRQEAINAMEANLQVLAQQVEEAASQVQSHF